MNPDIAVCASSDGTVTVLKVSHDISNAHGPRPDLKLSTGWVLQEVMKQEKLHSGSQFGGSSSCNSVACIGGGETIASAGEDGKIFLTNIKHTQPIRSYEKADSCSLNTVIFLRNDEVAAANMRGQLKIWDLRSKAEEPVTTCVLSSEQISIGCIAKHPTQQHILCSGSDDGMLAFWDLRRQTHPVTLLNAHQQSVNEIHFHLQQPEHMFSCSQSGDIWHWNGSNIATKPSASILNFGNQSSNQITSSNNDTACPWMNSEAVKNRVETQSLMAHQNLPVNTLSVMGNAVLVGGDNEAIYIIPNILY